jgi:PhoH-like ATPase
MSKRYVVDTNTLIENPEIIKQYDVVILSHVYREIEKLKLRENTSYKARVVSRYINEYCDNSNFDFTDYKFTLNDEFDPLYEDNKILQALVENKDKYCLVTNDILLKCKAKAYGIDIAELNITNDTEYKGYKLFSGGTAEINEFFEEINNGINKRGFLPNEYLIIYNTDLDDLYEYRFDGVKFVDLKLPPSKVIKGLNSQQRCALDLLNNKDIPIKIIAGGFGSGKTMLSVKTGLYQVVAKEHYKNLLFIRNPIVADNTDIGFLPGDKSEKIHDFCRPFLQYVENEKDQFYAENLIKNEKIKMDVVSFLKGISIDDSFVIMDEAEDLNTKLIKLVGSRIGEKSCIVFTGDWKQSENKYKNDNGLLRLIESSKGNPLVGIVVLEEDVRSSASKLFAEL